MSYQMVPRTEKTCKFCGKKFLGVNSKVYCSLDCRDDMGEKKYAARKKEIHKKAIAAGRKCQTCGKSLYAWSRKFCSDDCRGQAGRTFSNSWKRDIVFKIYPEAATDLARLREAWDRRSECAE